MAAATASQVPVFNFTHDSTASPFEQSPRAYLKAHPDPRSEYLATGALVFDTLTPSGPRILLLQRAAGDSMPHHWEVPGGGCDEEDMSVFHSVARELWEETGLQAKHISSPIDPPHFFTTRSGKKICRLLFFVGVGTGSHGRYDVNLDPKEHQNFVWATAEDIGKHRVGEIDLKFTTMELEHSITEAFKRIDDHGKIG